MLSMSLSFKPQQSYAHEAVSVGRITPEHRMINRSRRLPVRTNRASSVIEQELCESRAEQAGHYAARDSAIKAAGDPKSYDLDEFITLTLAGQWDNDQRLQERFSRGRVKGNQTVISRLEYLTVHIHLLEAELRAAVIQETYPDVYFNVPVPFIPPSDEPFDEEVN